MDERPQGYNVVLRYPDQQTRDAHGIPTRYDVVPFYTNPSEPPWWNVGSAKTEAEAHVIGAQELEEAVREGTPEGQERRRRQSVYQEKLDELIDECNRAIDRLYEEQRRIEAEFERKKKELESERDAGLS